MTKKILAYIDHFHGKVQPSSWEGLGVAASIAGDTGGEAAALIVGEGVGELAEAAFHHGADQVFLADDPILKDFRPEPLADVVKKAAETYQPDLILVPTTSRGRTLAGMAAVDLNTGVMVDVIGLDWAGGDIVATRPIYAGKLLAKLVCKTTPQVITLRTRAFDKPEPDTGRTGSATALEIGLDPGAVATTIVSIQEKAEAISLSDASVVVSGGRGVALDPNLEAPGDLDEEAADIWKAEKGFALINELALIFNKLEID